jgi:hypothetical protein
VDGVSDRDMRDIPLSGDQWRQVDLLAGNVLRHGDG